MNDDPFRRNHDPELHLSVAIRRAEQALLWAGERMAQTAAGVEPDPGRAFRERMERRITADQERRHAERTAPPEVVHRRVNGQTIIAQRLTARRTKGR
jgi:hypothetical protein